MEGVVYTGEVTLKNVPQDYKSSGAGNEDEQAPILGSEKQKK
jgi:hypothetical protein